MHAAWARRVRAGRVSASFTVLLRALSNDAAEGQPCVGRRSGKGRPAGPRAGGRRREASGGAEPHHAQSVSARSLEPENSIGGVAGSTIARLAGKGAEGRDAGFGMAKSGTSASILDRSGTGPRDPGAVHFSPRNCHSTGKIRAADLLAPTLVVGYSQNLRCNTASLRRGEIRLKSSPFLPTFTPSPGATRQARFCSDPAPMHLHATARCPDGLSGVLRRTDPPPLAPRLNP